MSRTVSSYISIYFWDGFLVPFYRKGYRHDIIAGFTGLSHKRRLPKGYACKVIEILTTNDEERANRLRILDDTYNKESKLVSGYKYFLSVLENASGVHRIAVDLLRERLISIDGLIHHGYL